MLQESCESCRTLLVLLQLCGALDYRQAAETIKRLSDFFIKTCDSDMHKPVTRIDA